jgi:hypothetical protein
MNIMQGDRDRLRPRRGSCLRWLPPLAILCALSPAAWAEHDHTAQALTFFLSAEGVHRSGIDTDLLDTDEGDLVADVLVGLRHDRWRLLGEFVLSPDEHEFERLQLGYEVSDNTVFWVGRYHQPASAWNIFYHHGQYLQTSITRPWIESWEDEGGITPQHISGVLFESQFSAGNESGWRISAGIGAAPQLQDDRLYPIGVFSDYGAAAGTNASVRLEWLPDQVGEDTVGLVGAHTELATNRSDNLFLPHVDYNLLGAFFSFGRARLRTIGAIYVIDVRTDSHVPPNQGKHVAGYLQLDYEIGADLTVFARHENLSDAKGWTYLEQFPNPLVRRSLAGLRWQVGDRNALSLEFDYNNALNSDAYTEARIQWSAALP